MANHPNRNRTPFTVRYLNQIAKFSSNRDAMEFAERMSQRTGHTIEVQHKTGLVGQYCNGVTTPEFAMHHECRDNG